MTQRSFQTMMREAESGPELAVEGAKLDFALALGRLMERQGLSRSDLAAKLKVSLPMVTKILRGDSNFTIETMVRVARAAGGSVQIHVVDDDAETRPRALNGSASSIRRQGSYEVVPPTHEENAVAESDPGGVRKAREAHAL
jgi:transcriptional regulator with XRE-family HTH domain